MIATRRFTRHEALVLVCGLMLAGSAHGQTASAPPLTLVNLRTESQQYPLGIDAAAPRLSWQIASMARDVRQGAYEIRVATDEAALSSDRRLWDSGKVISDQSTQLVYSGPSLKSGQGYIWQVRIWDATGRASAWSLPARWEMGLLSPTDWTADWIEPNVPEEAGKPRPAPMFRHDFDLHGPIVNARAYITSHGLYELYLNGQRVGDRLFTPGWTSYATRLQYQTYDVTSQLKDGANAVGVMVGEGWYRGTIGFANNTDHYGSKAGVLVQIEVTYADGHSQRIISDGTWKAATGPVLMSDIYNGEVYDARLERQGWANAGYDDHAWATVTTVADTKSNLLAQAGPPVRRIEEIKPVRIITTPAGETVVDMGQNMTGWVRLKVRGPAGTVVTLGHAEVLDNKGNFYTDNLRSAEQKIVYTLSGHGDEVYEPHFTFQGFRYVRVEGYPGKLSPDDITGVVVHSDMATTETFTSSNPLLNQLQHNIVWSQGDNFLDVPTDCPQRDERLGWTGDAQVFSPTAALNMDVENFYTKWLGDLAADQDSDGAIPHVVPDVLNAVFAGPGTPGQRQGGAAGWADVATVMPWNVYLAYGDTRILDKQYDSMRRWVQFETLHAGDDHIWSGDFQFGDWLDFASTAHKDGFGWTPSDLVATAYYAHSLDLLQKTATRLGKADDARRDADLLDAVRTAFNQRYVTAEGKVGSGTQTAYVLALDFDLLPQTLRASAAQHLADNVRAQGHLTTGFLGTPRLLEVLSRFGHNDEAYMLLNRQDYPSWLYPVTHGATTVWERWDGIKPDGSFQDKAMNSFNHYAYGAVGEWMYTVMGGLALDPAAPGYKHVLIQPQPGGGLRHVAVSHTGPYGVIRSDWRIDGHVFTLAVDIPPNSTATVRLPGATLAKVTEGRASLSHDAGVSNPRQDGRDVVIEIGSGHYDFRYPVE